MSDPTPTPIPDPLVEFFLDIAKDLGKSLWDITIGRGKKEIDWKISARRYAEEIIKQYGKIQVYGQARPTPLLDIFTDVYILEKPVALRRYDIQSLQKWFAEREKRASLHQREERMPGLSALDRTNNLFILGKPGAGKTTFLKYLAVLAAGGSAQLPYIPVFISLKAYADSGEGLLDFIARQFDICNFENAMPFIERMLKNGKALVLFDGLDEVSAGDGRRGEVIDALRDFSQKYDANKIVITCRVAATEYVFEGFEYVEMADFTFEQVERFITHWFGDEPALGEQMLAELGKPENEGILELTQNPLLLTLLCIAYEETLAFPARRVEVYEDAVDALLRKWDTSRRIKRDEIYRKLSLGRKRQMLARIAYETFRQGDYFIPQRRLEKLIVDYLARVPEAPDEVDIDGEAVLKAIAAQHGLLVERSRRIYSFSHLTFQEYFTAKYIVDNEARGAVDELVRHVFNDHWREVFLLVASMLDNADNFFNYFLAAIDDFALTYRLTSPLLVWNKISWEQWENANRGDTFKYSPSTIRALLLCFALNRFLDYVLTRVADYALDLLHAPEMSYISEVSQKIIKEIEFARSIVQAYNLACSVAEKLDDSFNTIKFRSASGKVTSIFYTTRSETVTSIFDYSLVNELANIHEFNLAHVHSLSHRITQSVSITKHINIQVPTSSSLLSVYELTGELDESLLSTIIEFPDRITNYLRGLCLLLDCLDVAIVNDRDAIKQRLLLPPTEH